MSDGAPRETSAGGVVVGPDGRIVVVSQKGASWSLPKGRVEPGEDLLDAARREVREETGLADLELVRPLEPYERTPLGRSSPVKRLAFFLFRTRQTALAPEDPDNPVAEWLAPDEAAARLTHPADRAFLAGLVGTALRK